MDTATEQSVVTWTFAEITIADTKIFYGPWETETYDGFFNCDITNENTTYEISFNTQSDELVVKEGSLVGLITLIADKRQDYLVLVFDYDVSVNPELDGGFDHSIWLYEVRHIYSPRQG